MEGLIGITFSKLWRLVRENNFNIDKPYWNKFLILILMSARNSLFQIKEKRLFEEKIQVASIPNLIFVLGHWRSGTTLLHSLITLHPDYSYPSQFQVSKPHVFLSREAAAKKMFNGMVGDKRAMDNVTVSFDSPGEDESAIAVGSLMSPYLGWTFPKRELFYDRYLCLSDINEKENKEWIGFFLYFLKKLSIRYDGKPLILKSPTHTARLGLLFKLFPNAKFIHLHRDPYTVYQSTLKLYRDAVPGYYLQNDNCCEVYEERIIRKYKLMYESYFSDYQLVPNNQICEVSFEELEQDKIRTLGRIWDQLNLSGFDQLESRLMGKIGDINRYKKNVYTEMDDQIKTRLYEDLRPSFERWNYPR